jgi:hypothetical protein
MVLPFEISQLDAVVVHLIFESLTEREFLPELGAYECEVLRNHIAVLIEHGYVMGAISATCSDMKNVRARSLTIRGYTLLSTMNAERRAHSAAPLPLRYYTRGWAMGA